MVDLVSVETEEDLTFLKTTLTESAVASKLLEEWPLSATEMKHSIIKI